MKTLAKSAISSDTVYIEFWSTHPFQRVRFKISRTLIFSTISLLQECFQRLPYLLQKRCQGAHVYIDNEWLMFFRNDFFSKKRRVTFGEKCAHGEGFKCINCQSAPETIPFRDKYSDYVVTSKMISDIAFHSSASSRIIRLAPAMEVEVPWQLNENPQRVSFGRKVNNGDPYRYKEPLSSAEAEEALNTTDPLSWLSWSILIDIKLFGHETAFSRIPQPQEL